MKLPSPTSRSPPAVWPSVPNRPQNVYWSLAWGLGTPAFCSLVYDLMGQKNVNQLQRKHPRCNKMIKEGFYSAGDIMVRMRTWYFQFSYSVVSDSLWRHGLQHARLPCPSPTPGACSSSYPLSQWCHSTIPSSVIPFSSCLQSFPGSGSFPMSQYLASGGQIIGASASVLPKLQHQSYSGLISFRFDWFDLLAVQGTLKSLPQHHSSKTSILWHSTFFMVPLSHPYMTTGKTTVLTRWTSVGKVISLLFNMLSRLVINFLPRRKHLLISWLQSPFAVILEPPKIKSVTVCIVSLSIHNEVMGLDAMIFIFWMLSFKPAFSLFSFMFIKRFFSINTFKLIGCQ